MTVKKVTKIDEVLLAIKNPTSVTLHLSSGDRTYYIIPEKSEEPFLVVFGEPDSDGKMQMASHSHTKNVSDGFLLFGYMEIMTRKFKDILLSRVSDKNQPKENLYDNYIG